MQNTCTSRNPAICKLMNVSYTGDQAVIHNSSVRLIVIWKLVIHSDPETPYLEWCMSWRSWWVSLWVSVCELGLWPLMERWEGSWTFADCVLSQYLTTHRRLSMRITLPHSWSPQNVWVVLLATVCLGTGYKQQGFLWGESVLIENFQKRKTEEFVNSLVTKVTFVEESHQWIVHIAAACLLFLHIVAPGLSWGEPTHPGGWLPTGRQLV